MRRLTTLCLTLLVACTVLWGQDNPVYKMYSWRPISKAQYIVKDLKGNKHDVQQLLRQGKKVLIDFSATWCGPCWRIHTEHQLETLYEEFGPEGKQSQDLVILWVEGEGASEGEIRDPGRDWTLISGSNGEEVPYPIISDNGLAPALRIEIEGWPTVAFISPAGEYTNIYSKGLLSNMAAMKQLLKACPPPPVINTPPSAGDLKAINFAFTDEPVLWKPEYRSDSPISSFAWEFEGANEPTSSKERPTVTWAKPGTYKVKFTITNAYGSASSETDFVVYDGSTTQFPIKETFENGNFPRRWRTPHRDADELSWNNLKMDLDRLNIPNDATKGFGYQSAYALASWSFYPTKATPKPGEENSFTFEGQQIFPNNWLISPPINIPDTEGIDPTLTFATTSFLSGTRKEKYEVRIARGPGIQSEDFDLLLKAPYATNDKREWLTEKISLSRFKGQRISIAFVHKALKNGPGVLIDDIAITLKPDVAIDAPEAKNVKVYPTVADQKITVECAEGATVVLLNLYGGQLFRQDGVQGIVEIATDNLPVGTYFVRVMEREGATKVVPIIVQR